MLIISGQVMTNWKGAIQIATLHDNLSVKSGFLIGWFVIKCDRNLGQLQSSSLYQKVEMQVSN